MRLKGHIVYILMLDKTADQITYVLPCDEIKCNKRKVFYPCFKKVWWRTFAITSPAVNQFREFFHCWKQK